MPRRRSGRSRRAVRVALPRRAKRRSHRRIRVRRTAVAALVLLVSVLFLTLSPEPPTEDSVAGGCFWCGHFALADAILNLLLFLPVGFLLGLRSRANPLRLWIGLTVLSGGIELAQIFLPGRFPTLSDVLMNSLGAAIGIALALRWRRGPLLPGACAGAAPVAAGALAACLTLGSTVLLQPSLPESEWFGQWTPDLGHYEQYEGEVLDAGVGGRGLPDTRLDEPGDVRDQIMVGTPIELSFVAGSEPAGLAPIFAIYDRMEREILVFGGQGEDLVVRLRRRASDWRLRSPEARHAGAAPRAGDTVTARLSLRDRSTCLESRSRGCLALATPGRGWSLLLGAAPSLEIGRISDGVWLGFAFLPLGYWLRRRRGNATGLTLGGFGLLGSILLAGEMAVVDWLTVGLGVPLGLLAGVWAGRALSPAFSEARRREDRDSPRSS